MFCGGVYERCGCGGFVRCSNYIIAYLNDRKHEKDLAGQVRNIIRFCFCFLFLLVYLFFFFVLSVFSLFCLFYFVLLCFVCLFVCFFNGRKRRGAFYLLLEMVLNSIII